MPTSLLKAYAKESGKSLDEAEKCWAKAKHQADAKFNGKKDGHYWAYTNASTRLCLGLPEHATKKDKDKTKEHKKKK